MAAEHRDAHLLRRVEAALRDVEDSQLRVAPCAKSAPVIVTSPSDAHLTATLVGPAAVGVRAAMVHMLRHFQVDFGVAMSVSLSTTPGNCARR